MTGRTLRWVAAATVAATLGLGTGLASAAPEGRIQQVEFVDGSLTYVLSAEGLADGQSIDSSSVRTTLDGIDATTTAVPVVADEGPALERTTMIVLDSSGSMADDDKLAKAQDAAKQYLGTLPADVKAGLITFADDARVEVAPTDDRAKVAKAIDGLEANGATALNDAVVLTAEELGAQGSRNAVLLSDGEDEGSDTSAKSAAKTLKKSGVILDAVSLGTGEQTAQLAAFAKAGNGSVVTATDATELTAAFQAAARTVVTQLAVTAEVPDGVSPGTSEMVSAALVGEMPITDTAIAVIGAAGAPATAGSAPAHGPVAVAEAVPTVFDEFWFLPLMLVLLFVAIAAVVALTVGAFSFAGRKHGRVARRLEAVSIAGAPTTPATKTPETVLGESPTIRRAVSYGDRIAASRNTTALVRRLEEANVALRPGEWVVVHGLVAFLAVLFTMLLSELNMMLVLIGFGLGLGLPWAYLGYLGQKRRKQFYAALPDAMQMLAGSLSAGYSLPQAMDNVAKESGGPLGQEINRALLESRLGLPLEETLEAVAQRMDSLDFHWVVMAISVNRRIGGNLAEVLTNVGKTLRERERLRRQVKTLSAEGVLSAWIIGLLPFLVLGGVLALNPGYIMPMLSQPIGWAILAIGGAIYIIGIFWMRNLVRMEV